MRDVCGRWLALVGLGLVIGCGGDGPSANPAGDASVGDAAGGCEAGTFDAGAACTGCRACGDGEYELSGCLPTADRTCAALPALTGLAISAGALEPALTPTVFAYATAVGLFTDAVTLTPTADLVGATITIAGAPVASGAASPPIALGLGATPVTIAVTSADGLGTRIYTVVVDRASTVLQQAYAKASSPGLNDQTGVSVAVAGDTLVVGAPGEDSSATGIDGPINEAAGNSGAAYVFVRTGAAWTQQAYVKASNTGAGDAFGTSVALSGETLVIGAPGEDSGAVGVDGDQASNAATDSGAVYVFTRTGTTWSQQAYLKASNTGAGDAFGHSVAVSGDTVAVGAFREDSSATGVDGDQASNVGTDSGAVYAFARTGAAWAQQAYLKASNTGGGDQLGRSVSVSGDTVVAGAWTEDSGATGVDGDGASNTAADSGAAYVYARSGTAWAQQAYLKASNTGASDYFGWSVAVAGDTLVIGAPYEDSSATGVGGSQASDGMANSGACYVLTRSGTTWSQQAYLKASNPGAGDSFGWSVALRGSQLAVGAPYEDSSAAAPGGDQADDAAVDSGAAYLFGRTGTTWAQHVYVKPANTGAADEFGYSVALAPDALAVGAWLEDSSATGVDGDGASDALANSGAAYVLR